MFTLTDRTIVSLWCRRFKVSRSKWGNPLPHRAPILRSRPQQRITGVRFSGACVDTIISGRSDRVAQRSHKVRRRRRESRKRSMIDEGTKGNINPWIAGNRVQRQEEPTHIDPISLLFLLQRLDALHEVRGVLIIIPNDPHALSEQNGHMCERII